jgi:hypothetical protein
MRHPLLSEPKLRELIAILRRYEFAVFHAAQNSPWMPRKKEGK